VCGCVVAWVRGCVGVLVYIRVCICKYSLVCLPSSLSPHLHIRVHIHTLPLPLAHTHVLICTHLQTHTRTRARTNTRTHTHAHTHTHTHTRTHTHSQNMGSWSVEMYPPRIQIHLHRAGHMIVYVYFFGLEEGVTDAYISSVCVCVCMCVCVCVCVCVCTWRISAHTWCYQGWKKESREVSPYRDWTRE